MLGTMAGSVVPRGTGQHTEVKTRHFYLAQIRHYYLALTPDVKAGLKCPVLG